MQSKKNVVITGMGAVTPFGLGVKTLWKAVIRGASAIRNIQRFSVPTGITDIAATLPEEIFDQLHSEEQDSLYEWAMNHAYDELLKSANLTEESLRTKKKGAIFFSNHFELDGYVQAENNNSTIAKSEIEQWHLAKWANWLQRRTLAKSGNGIITGCTGSHTAIATGMESIAEGVCDWAIVGGGDFLHPELMVELDSLRILSSTGCRPFFEGGDGTVVADGLGLLLLESEASAYERNAPIYAVLKGSAIAMDTIGLGQFTNDGSVLKRTMEQALSEADIPLGEVGYVQAAATGATKVDNMEKNALHNLFQAKIPPVSSLKSQIGHSVGGTGVLSHIVTALGLKEQSLPPTIGEYDRTPSGLDTVPISRPHNFSTALINGVSMSGHLCTVVMEKGDI